MLAIHDKQVLVMTVMQFQTGHPAAIGHPAHWGRGHIPSIEIAHQADMRSSWRVTEEINMMKRAFGGVTPRKRYWSEFGFECRIHRT